MCVCMPSKVQLFTTPWSVACQAPLCPWDSPGKNIGVGYHFFLQKMRWLDSIIHSMDMNWSKLHETVEDRGA